MTLYLDTSSAIKLYVSEVSSEKVRRLVEDAAIVATSVVTYAETRAALARLRRERALTVAKFRSAKREFEEQWPSFMKLDATDALDSRRACRTGPIARVRQRPLGIVCRGRTSSGAPRDAVLELRRSSE